MMQEEEIRLSAVGRAQTGLASQHIAMSGENGSTNSDTWVVSSFLLIIFKVMVEKTQKKELYRKLGFVF